MGLERVLVVDDSETILAVMTDILAGMGLASDRVATASTEDAALARIATSVPNVVFLDMELGEGRGETVMRAVLRAAPLARIVLMTGLSREDPRVVGAISGGAFAHLRKPVRRDAVAAVFREIEEESSGFTRIR